MLKTEKQQLLAVYYSWQLVHRGLPVDTAREKVRDLMRRIPISAIGNEQFEQRLYEGL